MNEVYFKFISKFTDKKSKFFSKLFKTYCFLKQLMIRYICILKEKNNYLEEFDNKVDPVSFVF